MHDDPLPHLRDVLLRRDLTPQELESVSRWLALHPDATPEWQRDLALAASIRRLPAARLSNHFTSQVMEKVRLDLRTREREAAQAHWPAWLKPWFRPQAWIPVGSVAVTVAVAVAGWDWSVKRSQAQFTRDVTPLRALAQLPPEILQDFDAIQRFGESSPPVDLELLAALE